MRLAADSYYGQKMERARHPRKGGGAERAVGVHVREPDHPSQRRVRPPQRRGALSEDDVDEAMREVRIALLEADVALPVVQATSSPRCASKRHRRGGDPQRSRPGQVVVKIVHDELVAMLGGDSAASSNLGAPPAVVLMAGLQGSGKTTTAAKLAPRLQVAERKKVLLASLDVHRPAAHGAAGGAGAAGRGREPADRRRPAAARHRPPRARDRPAQGYDVADPRHRRPPARRRGDDGRGGRGARRSRSRTRPCSSPTR